MKLRNTILLLILCVGLFAYIKLYDSKKLSTDELRERKGRVVEVDRDSIDTVTVRNSEGSIEIRKNQDGSWMIESPVKDRADSLVISTLLTSLEGLRMEPVPAGKGGGEAMAEYGLTKGDASIKVAGKKPFELLIGKETAVEGRVYMRVEGKDGAYVAPKDLRDQATKALKEWRDRKLSDLTATQVNKVVVKTAKGEIEAAKTAGHWSLTRPFKGRADDQKITDLISNATTQRIEDFLTDTKDLGAFGLNEPRATVTFHAEGATDPVVLQIGNPKKADKPEEKTDGKKPDAAPATPTHVYVRLSNRDGVMTVSAAIESLLNTQPNELRDQNLMRVQTDMVDRITIEAAGREKIVLGRNGEEWVRKVEKQGDSRVNGGAANKLLSDLTSMAVSRFVADVAGDPKQYGLDAPQVSVTLSSYSTEGTPETKPGERPLARLLLGKFEGDAGFAKLDDEPFIVAVPSSILDGIWTDPLQWQELKIQELKREDFVAIEITRTGQPTLAIRHEKEKGWKLAKGDGVVNQAAADSLINTLANLHAVRWAGATVADHGLEKPNLLITYTLADKKAGKLTVGSNTADEMWHATIEGRPGTFLLSRPDFDALNGALIETAKPAAPPAAPAAVPASPPAVIPPAAVEVPPAAPAPPKPVEAPPGGTNPAPQSAPKP